VTKNDTDFSKQIQELEEITAWFESDDVDLSQALAKFERGMVLVADLRGELQQVENKVEKIKQRFDEPRPDKAPAADIATEDAPPDLFS
jgi:exodeoxyribonuclease VII small subunit